MAGFADATETDILELFLNATTFDGIAENDSTSPDTQFHESLHTADPTDSGNQTSSETTYTSYAREPIARTSGGWTVSGNSGTHASAITFDAGTGGSGTITHMGLGTDLSGTGRLYAAGTVSPNFAVGDGVTPQLGTATALTLD